CPRRCAPHPARSPARDPRSSSPAVSKACPWPALASTALLLPGMHPATERGAGIVEVRVQRRCASLVVSWCLSFPQLGLSHAATLGVDSVCSHSLGSI